MQILSETVGRQGWSGVFSSSDPTLLAPNASPRGYNSALALATAGVPYVQKRQGMRTINATAVSGSPAILANADYYRIADATHRQMLISNTGRVDVIGTDGTLTNISTGLTSGNYYPDWAVANDLFFLVNGQDAKKFDGTSLSAFGITRPTVGTLAGAAGASGSPNGTYELRVSYANSSTGHESSASDTAASTVTVSSQKISVSNVPVSGDSQVDTRYLYVRNTSTMTQFYRAGTISDNSTTTITLDFADANLVTVGPTTDENDPPPSGIKYLCFHEGRLFAATDSALYYSKIDKPEAFPPINVEYVNQSDGQKITGLSSGQQTLLILKEDRSYGLFNGNDPAAWEIITISSDYGCASHRTIRTINNDTYWWGRHGLIKWSAGTSVDPIGMRLYGDPSTAVNYSSISTASACKDENNARLLVALPGPGQSRATFLLPFNVLLQTFEATLWDPMDAASLGEGVDSSGVLRPYLGNYAGQLFRLWDTNADGIAVDTTTTGTFVASATSMTTIADAAATFDTTGAGLIERKVTILDSDGQIITSSIRPYIESNTATAFTLHTAVDGLVAGATYTYVIGGPDFQWDTRWSVLDTTWVKKRFEYLFMLIKGVSYGAAASVDIAFDWDDANGNAKQRTFTSTASTGTWDDSLTLWDSSVWDAPSNDEERFRIARVGRSYRVRVRNSAANQPFALLELGVQAVAETTKN